MFYFLLSTSGLDFSLLLSLILTCFGSVFWLKSVPTIDGGKGLNAGTVLACTSNSLGSKSIMKTGVVSTLSR